MTTPPQPQLALSPRRRFVLWLAFVAALSIVDLTLTTIALAGVPLAPDRNPLVALASDQGILTATVLKVLAFELLLIATFAIDPAIFTKTTEKAIIGWSLALLILNAWTTLQLIGVI